MRRTIILLVLLIGLLVLSACQQQAPAPETFEASRDRHTTFTLPDGATAVLDIKTSAGDISIQPGDSVSTVQINIRRTAYGTSQRDAEEELDEVRMDAAQDGATITLDALQRPIRGQRTNRVDLALTVPEHVALTLATTTGTIKVQGIRVTEPLSIRNAAGSTTLTDVIIAGGMTLDGGAGDILFNGTLGTTGHYTITGGAGIMTVLLPADTAAQIEARSTVGTVTVEGLEVSGGGSQTIGAGSQITGRLGAGGALLRLTMNIGDIRLRGQ